MSLTARRNDSPFVRIRFDVFEEVVGSKGPLVLKRRGEGTVLHPNNAPTPAQVKAPCQFHQEFKL